MNPTSVNVTVRLDRNIKEGADLLFDELWLLLHSHTS